MLVLAASGCSYLRSSGGPRKPQIKALQLGTNSMGTPQTVRSLQIEVMRFADNYAAVIAYGCDEFAERMPGSEARLVAAKWKLEQATAAFINASGPNPTINALDMVVLTTASRMVIMDRLKFQGAVGAAATLIDAHHKFETNAWSLMQGLLTTKQLQDLRELIEDWRRNNPEERNVTTLRFRQFLGALEEREPRAGKGRPSSFFGLLFLDPMASMDPATAAIEETRNTAERAMYYTQRMPRLLNWQVELLTYSLVVQPEAKQLLSETERITKVSEALAKTVERLPEVIDKQREAAINQLLDGLSPETDKGGKLLGQARETALEARKALEAGSVMATSVDTAIRSLDQFMRAIANTNASAASTNSKPFDVLDYATTAGAVGAAAKDVTTLLVSANESASQLTTLRQQTTADAKAVVDHAYSRALIVVVALVLGGLLAGILFRVATRRGNQPAAAVRTDPL